jgi:hypothetical protein
LLGYEMLHPRPLDMDSWSEEKISAFFANDDAFVARNYWWAAYWMLTMKLKGAPFIERGVWSGTVPVPAMIGWYRANEHRLPEVLKETWGDDLLPDPPGLAAGTIPAPDAGKPPDSPEPRAVEQPQTPAQQSSSITSPTASAPPPRWYFITMAAAVLAAFGGGWCYVRKKRRLRPDRGD